MDGKEKIVSKSLDELLHGPDALPVLVKEDGAYGAAPYPPARLEDYAPESIDVDWSGDWDMPDILESHERDAIDSIENGWRVLTGWTHGSLFIFDAEQRHFGRDLEEHIIETPGLWAIVSVAMHPPICEAGEDGMPCAEYSARERCEHADYPPESEAAGWALVHKELTEGEGK